MMDLTYNPMEDALDSLSHLDAERVDAAGGFVAVRVPRDNGGEILLNPDGNGWDIGRYGPGGEDELMIVSAPGDHTVEIVACMLRGEDDRARELASL